MVSHSVARTIGLFLLMCFLHIQALAGEQSQPLEGTKVAFFSPAGENNSYWWNTCSYFMRSAAQDLGMNLDIYYADRSQKKLLTDVDTVLKASDVPDYFVLQNMKSTAVDVIEKTSQTSVQVLLFNSGLSDREQLTHGSPREKYANWIGQIVPNDESAGYQLAETLVNAARRKGLFNQNGKIEMLALGGTVSDTSALEREKGLMRYLDLHKTDVTLNRDHVLPANWQSTTAGAVFETAFSLFPNTTVIWNANDNMAMGVLNTAKTQLGLEPGTDILIGGIDWNPDALESVKTGELEVTIGGHFAECIWTMILLYDYANGVDLEKSESTSMSSKFSTLTRSNVEQYSLLLSGRSPEKIKSIDFKKFSKFENPVLDSYQFDLELILEQLQ